MVKFYCKRCGKEIEDFHKIYFESCLILDIDTREVTKSKYELELCESCHLEFKKIIDSSNARILS
jgi:Zn finger protein HypA/HybF involved in hydrogenase expression